LEINDHEASYEQSFVSSGGRSSCDWGFVVSERPPEFDHCDLLIFPADCSSFYLNVVIPRDELGTSAAARLHLAGCYRCRAFHRPISLWIHAVVAMKLEPNKITGSTSPHLE